MSDLEILATILMISSILSNVFYSLGYSINFHVVNAFETGASMCFVIYSFWKYFLSNMKDL